ncbi:Ataxin2like proteinlike, partial [Caligus rogercresseyi]
VETQSEGTFEGILWTISRFLDVVLVQSHLVNLENPTEIKQETLEDKRTFHAKDIVRLTALDVDLDYATKSKDTKVNSSHRMSPMKLEGGGVEEEGKRASQGQAFHGPTCL